MYLHHILSRDEKELIKRVYSAQKENTTKGDFAEQVKADLEVVEMNEESVVSMSKGAFKSLVKEKVNEAAKEALNIQQKEHSKVNDIKY